MKTICRAWLPLLTLLFLVAQPAIAASPERDIVSVTSEEPLPAAEVMPGLLTGQRIMNDLRDALELVRAGVLDAAAPGLESVLGALRDLQNGEGPVPPLPASYRTDGELWLPVRAQLLQVELDAPDLLPRPKPGQAGGQVANLPAKARRIYRLPVEITAQRVEQALHQVRIGNQEQAQQLLEAALQGAQPSLELEHQSLISAYYDVESAVAAAPRWDDETRNRLRRAAEALYRESGAGHLADRLQTQADRATPDLRQLQDLALTLRKRVAGDAGPASSSTSTPTTDTRPVSSK